VMPAAATTAPGGVSVRPAGRGLEARAETMIAAEGVAAIRFDVTGLENPVTVGREATDSPKNAAHLWSRYDFSSGRLAGLGVGLGISYTGEREGLLPTTKAPDVTTLPANTITDLAFYYTLKKVQITLKVSNLTDKRYIESESLGNTIFPGAPRQVVLALRTTFD